jgi:hypothetical protein
MRALSEENDIQRSKKMGDASVAAFNFLESIYGITEEADEAQLFRSDLIRWLP